MDKSVPLERKLIERVFNGKVEKIPAIDPRWIEEDNRIFSLYPHLPLSENDGFLAGEDKAWLELASFVQDNLQWLLELEHHKFWSYMVYDKEPHDMLVSFLSDYPPEYMKKHYLVNEDIEALFQDIQHLVFLVFVRLSTAKESEECYFENLGEVLYENYLFTVPILLDICVIYGTSNPEIVGNMISTVLMLEPRFINDFQEIVPYFFRAINIVKNKFSVENGSSFDMTESQSNNLRDLILYLHDSVCTIETFLSLSNEGCKLFWKSKYVAEIASFYSNELPKIYKTWGRSGFTRKDRLSAVCSDLIEKTRLDILKTIKHIFDSVSAASTIDLDRREELIDDYLNMMLELLSESSFISDYNLLYSVEFEISLVTQNCSDVDTIKINHILEGVAFVESTMEAPKPKSIISRNDKPPAKADSSARSFKFNPLITKVKDILPQLEEQFIEECLKHYKNNTESVVEAILEDSLPVHLRDWVEETCQDIPLAGTSQTTKVKENFDEFEYTYPGDVSVPKPTQQKFIEYTGKHKSQYDNLNDLLEDKTELKEIRDRYIQLSLLEEDTYEDEYDDTYDDNLKLVIGEADGSDEKERRPFEVPRVLRKFGESGETEESEEEAEEETQKPKDCFVQNPAELREMREQKRQESMRRNVVGRGRGQGQSRDVTRNRDFKGAHKSFMGNHNRKKQANRKKNQGMIPS